MYGQQFFVRAPRRDAGRAQSVGFEHRGESRRQRTAAAALELGTIAGELLEPLLFEFVLSYSTWRWVAVAFGETYEALVAGLQGALWALGGVPEVVRSDNLSAATHDAGRDGAAPHPEAVDLDRGGADLASLAALLISSSAASRSP